MRGPKHPCLVFKISAFPTNPVISHFSLCKICFLPPLRQQLYHLFWTVILLLSVKNLSKKVLLWSKAYIFTLPNIIPRQCKFSAIINPDCHQEVFSRLGSRNKQVYSYLWQQGVCTTKITKALLSSLLNCEASLAVISTGKGIWHDKRSHGVVSPSSKSCFSYLSHCFCSYTSSTGSSPGCVLALHLSSVPAAPCSNCMAPTQTKSWMS